MVFLAKNNIQILNLKNTPFLQTKRVFVDLILTQIGKNTRQ